MIFSSCSACVNGIRSFEPLYVGCFSSVRSFSYFCMFSTPMVCTVDAEPERFITHWCSEYPEVWLERFLLVSHAPIYWFAQEVRLHLCCQATFRIWSDYLSLLVVITSSRGCWLSRDALRHDTYLKHIIGSPIPCESYSYALRIASLCLDSLELRSKSGLCRNMVCISTPEIPHFRWFLTSQWQSTFQQP